MRPVTVRRPRLYARTPPIQNLGETEIECKISAHLDLNWQSYSHQNHCGCALKFFHLYTGNWQNYALGIQRRHTRSQKKNLSRFGRRNPEKFNFENLWKFVENFDGLTERLTHSVTRLLQRPRAATRPRPKKVKHQNLEQENILSTLTH